MKLSVIADYSATIIEIDGHMSIFFAPSGFELHFAFDDYLKTHHSLLASRLGIDRAILALGIVNPTLTPCAVQVDGRNLTNGLPVTKWITSHDLQAAITSVLNEIVRYTASNIKPHLIREGQEILNAEDAILLKGEFRHVYGLAEGLEKAIGVKIVVDV